LGITDLDISPAPQQDLIVTSGKDSKVKIWISCNLLSNEASAIETALLCEFGDAASEVTQVKFSPISSSRVFSTSTDKVCRIYDTAA